jgi:SRSO17 transposase
MEVRGLMSAPEAVLASAERQGFVARAFTAWAIEDSFETAKNEFGRSQREPILAWLASSRFHDHARLRHDGGDSKSR